MNIDKSRIPLGIYWEDKDGKRKRTHLTDANFHCSSQNIVMAMANSGDYTLEEALAVYGAACERCGNVLAYKYTDGKEGYAEYSDEWRKCNTECKFCKGEK